MTDFHESHVESVTLGWFADLGYEVRTGQEIAPGEPAAERASYGDVVLVGRLRAAIDRLNPQLPAEARDEAHRKVLQPQSPALLVNNRAFLRMLRDGVEVEYRRTDGTIAGDRARLVSDEPDENDWLVVNQFTVIEGTYNRRPDIVAFVNGLPFAALEIKSALDEDATIWNAWNQLQTYQMQLPRYLRTTACSLSRTV
jgi:type I restriction enzyme R subunit